MRILVSLFAALFLLSCRAPTIDAEQPLAIGAWSLNQQASVISFITVKNGSVSESHEFQTFTGQVSADGSVIIAIDLESVETNIDVRNERMREHLFQTNTHRQASISANLDLDALYALDIGERITKTIPLKVGLHGAVETLGADMFITRIARGKVLVETRAPIHIYAGDYDLIAGLAKLQSLAKLSSIAPSVPVSVSLVFEAKPPN